MLRSNSLQLANTPKMSNFNLDHTKIEIISNNHLGHVFRTFLTVRSKTWNGIKLGGFFIQIRWLGVSWESVYP